MSRPDTLPTATATLKALARQLSALVDAASQTDVADFCHALRSLAAEASVASCGIQADLSTVAMGREIARSLRITQESVDGAPIGIFRLDDRGNVVSVNRAACESLGYTREELESLSVADFDPNFNLEKWLEHRSRLRGTSGTTFTTMHRRKDGSTFPVEISLILFEFEGEQYSVSFVKDLTEHHRVELERRQLEARMLQAQKLESLGVLAGGIAHDFNNLLMVMLGNLELALCDAPASTRERNYLSDASQAARQAADLCRQLLIYAGKGKSQTEPVDLGALLKDQAKMLEVSASKSIRLVLNLAPDLPKVRADVSQLRQVFMNLIINASDAVGQGPGMISISTSTVTCDSEYLNGLTLDRKLEPGLYVSVEVSDTGCGMDEAVRERIFDPFFSTKTASRGLGLAAVRGIVNNHNGCIRVYSEVGKGTTFRLFFPVPKHAVEVEPGLQGVRSWKGSGWVLVVDDEETLRSLAARMLVRFGFQTISASNGNEALSLFKEHRHKIEYVLLDWTMPEMGGGETFAELRRLDPDLRIILASGHAPDDILTRLGGRRVTAFVRKPYNLAELSAALQEASGAR